MLRLLANSEQLVAWVEDRLGTKFFRDARAIGWGDDDRVRAAVAYERWTEVECSIHVASDGAGHWLTRPFLAAIFFYPFVQANRRRLTVPVPADNEHALRFVRHIGFRDEGVLRQAGADGCDIIILGMLRQECRFLPREYRGA